MHATKSWFLAIALASTLVGRAAAVDYKFSGTVTSVAPQVASRFDVGDVVSGKFSFKFSTTFGGQQGGGVLTSFSANIGDDYAITGAAPNSNLVILNDFGGRVDALILHVGPVAPAVAGHVPDYFNFHLVYEGLNQLTSPNYLPQFVFGNYRDLSLLRFDVNDAIAVNFRLTDLSLIPEPSTMLLTAAGIAMISLCCGRASRRRIENKC